MVHKRTLDAKEKYEGAVFKTNNYGDVEVTEYIDSHNITVKFLNTLLSCLCGSEQEQLSIQSVVYTSKLPMRQ